MEKMMNKKGNVEIGILILSISILSTLWFLCSDMILTYQKEIIDLQSRALKYGYAQMVQNNGIVLFKFNAEIEGENK